MREQTMINALEMHDKAINGLRYEFKVMQKVLDKAYVISLTHVMMWDILFKFLQEKGIFTKEQFDVALKDLQEKTKAAMDSDQKKKAEEAELVKGKVTVLSDVPVIPVVK